MFFENVAEGNPISTIHEARWRVESVTFPLDISRSKSQTHMLHVTSGAPEYRRLRDAAKRSFPLVMPFQRQILALLTKRVKVRELFVDISHSSKVRLEFAQVCQVGRGDWGRVRGRMEPRNKKKNFPPCLTPNPPLPSLFGSVVSFIRLAFSVSLNGVLEALFQCLEYIKLWPNPITTSFGFQDSNLHPIISKLSKECPDKTVQTSAAF